LVKYAFINAGLVDYNYILLEIKAQIVSTTLYY